MVKNCLYVIAVAALLLHVHDSIAADAGAGKQKSQTCAACHSPDGNSTINPSWPKLAGQNSEYLVKQLSDFKSGARKNPQMAAMVASLSKQDMEDLAAYFSSQTTSIGTTSKGELELGRKIYRAGNADTGVPACMACHGPDGAGNPAAAYPKLSGQHAPYDVKQLKAFRSGDRSNDPNRIMRIVAAHLTDKEISAVADYIQGLY